MLMEILYPYVKFTLGTLYPSYKTWKALKRKDETTRRRWMKYWVSFGAFQMFELVADITLAFICPFYIELKLMAIMWLVMGTKLVFDSIVNRELAKREKIIDKYLGKVNKARDEIIALIWYEISRCSVKIVTAIMSGGLSVVLATPRTPDASLCTSPVCSDDDETDGVGVSDRRRVHYGPVTFVAAMADLSADEEEEVGDDFNTELMDHEEQQETTVHYREPDFNENLVSMEWTPTTTKLVEPAATTKDSNATTTTNSQSVIIKHAGTGLRKSARREQMNLKSRTTRVTSIKEID